MNNSNQLPSAFSLFKPSTNVIKSNIINIILLILPAVVVMAGLAITFGTNIFDSSSFAVEQNIELKNSILYVPVALLLAA